MNTRILMLAAAWFSGLLGLLASFLPVEILGSLDDLRHNRIEAVIVQLLGAALLAFAMLNWMAKGAPLGGIYGRPIMTANLVHFTVGGIALVKAAVVGDLSAALLAVTIGYVLFAVCFGLVMFGRGPIGALEHLGPG